MRTLVSAAALTAALFAAPVHATTAESDISEAATFIAESGATETGLPAAPLPLAHVVRLMGSKGYDVVKVGLRGDAYEAVLRTTDGRLVEVRIDPETAQLSPLEGSDLLSNIIDLAG